jgi:hypothetical protein
MTKTRLATALTLGLLAVGSPALAADGDGGTATVTGTVGSVLGERSVTLVSPVALAAVDATTLEAPLAVEVTETSRTGTNPWSVTATMSDLTSGSSTIPGSALSVGGRSVVQTLGGGASAAPSGEGSLGTAQTLFTNTGQDTSKTYSGTYASASTLRLTVPNGAVSGAYTGTLTVTLVQ